MELNYTMGIGPAEDEDGTYFGAYFPDLPGCTTLGKNLEDLRKNAMEAVTLHIQALRDTGQPVPHPNISVETITVKAS